MLQRLLYRSPARPVQVTRLKEEHSVDGRAFAILAVRQALLVTLLCTRGVKGFKERQADSYPPEPKAVFRQELG